MGTFVQSGKLYTYRWIPIFCIAAPRQNAIRSELVVFSSR